MRRQLQGVRVIDLTRYGAGPFGTMILADLGAEVIKVEEREGGDPARNLSPVKLNGEDALFLSLNRNKRSLTLDIRKPRGREILLELVKKADVVVDNFRASALKRLGIDYERLKEVNPSIICCSITGFGHTGPYSDLTAYDSILQSMGGTMSITGEPGRKPVLMGLPMADWGGGIFAAHGILAALYQKAMSGEGQKIDISLLDGQIFMLNFMAEEYLLTGQVPGPQGWARPIVAPSLPLECKDGRTIFMCAFQQKYWEKLCSLLEKPEWLKDPRFETSQKRASHRGILYPLLEEKFKERTTQEWLSLLRTEGIPSGPVNTVDMALNDPQVQARNMVVDIDHPTCGRFKAIGTPIKTSTAPDDQFSPPPILGQHTDEVLRDLLGFSQEKVEALRKEEVI